MCQYIKSTLPAPVKDPALPFESQWLAGEGAGSWFNIEAEENSYKITRYSPAGKIECEGFFSILNNDFFDIHQVFQFTHLSHCQMVNVIQGNKTISFQRIN